MTTPVPTPTGPVGPSAVNSAIAGLGALPVPAGTDKSLYGLGVWSAHQIDPGDLPFPVTATGPNGTVTAEDILKAFAQAGQVDPQAVSTIQHALLLGGYYSDGSYVPYYGIVRKEDIDAFTSAVVTAGQGGGDVASHLADSAQMGFALGQQAAQAKARTQVSVPNAADLAVTLDNAFKTVTGRKATDEEKAAFAHLYQGLLVSAANQASALPAEPDRAGQLTPADQTSLDPVMANRMGHSADPDLAHPGPLSVTPESFAATIADLVPPQSQQAEQSGTQAVEAPPDPSVAAENFAREHAPREAAGHQVADTFQTFLSLLGGPSFG